MRNLLGKPILTYDSLSRYCTHGFSPCTSDVNFYTSRQGIYGLHLWDALAIQRRFLTALGFDQEKEWLTLGCVGGTDILRLTNENKMNYVGYGADLHTHADGFDGVYTQVRGIPLCVGFADCPQILVAGNDLVGIIHAGRVNMDKSIINKFLSEVSKVTDPRGLVFGMSPHVRGRNYLHMVVFHLRRYKEWMETGVITPHGKDYAVDLTKAIMDDFDRNGIRRDRVFDSGLDTFVEGCSAAKMGNMWINSKRAHEALMHKHKGIKRGSCFCAVML
jgi:copper oxidase (laccase) domain-containing protein